MKEAIYHFPIDGSPVSCEQIKSGHINETYLITTDTGARYILQWINQYVFPNVNAIMNNMSAISAYLREHEKGQMAMISYIDTLDGHSYYDDGQGGAWRIYRFVDNSVCLQLPECPRDFYECARAFGHFQEVLSGFPAQRLEETIVNFHNTVDRYRQLREAVAKNEAGRLGEVEEEVRFVLQREERACRLHRMREQGLLPVRATHNDTKINNVLLDGNTHRALCVIDLDTVMPGLSAFDFGDSIRFGASTAAEDEPDLSRVHLDLGLYRVYVRGFLEACPSLTPAEIEVLPLGAYTMTLEVGLRFLADYLNGDRYFSIEYPEHNKVRCRTQFKLIRDMEAHWEDMNRIVAEERAALEAEKET